jgi:hypothetical protein
VLAGQASLPQPQAGGNQQLPGCGTHPWGRGLKKVPGLLEDSTRCLSVPGSKELDPQVSFGEYPLWR